MKAKYHTKPQSKNKKPFQFKKDKKTKRVPLKDKIKNIYYGQVNLDTTCNGRCECCKVAMPQMNYCEYIQLMNEIWRVLEPNGLFYGVTPAYPSHKSFVDPTHVNFISKKTHEYFVGNSPLARMYGFKGYFDVVRVQRIRPKHVYEPSQSTLGQKIISLSDMIALRRSHLIWEFSKSNNKN